MIIKRKTSKFGVIDPKGKVSDNWFSVTDLINLAKELDVKIPSKGGIDSVIAGIEDLGYVIIMYGDISYNVRVPKDSLYRDWESVQMN